MKNLLIASAVAAALYLPAGAYAAAPAANDVAQIREQLQGLMQRVDKLEQENNSLKSENETLKSQGDKLSSDAAYLKAETKGLRKDSATLASEAAKVKGADWAGKITLKGDLRYRYEMIKDDTANAAGVLSTADRYRDRIRARFNAEAKATDTILVGLGFATTEGGDPRSSNQTLTGSFSRKSLDLDLAYFDWKFANGADLIGGKMKQPFFKTAQSVFWDNDINPEGLAVTYSSGIFFGTVYNYWLNEVSGAENTVTADASMAGIQIGTKLPIGASVLTLAAHYYDLSAAEGRSPFFNANSNGNTTRTVNTVAVLANDFEVANVTAELNMNLGAFPLMLWADAAQNQAVDDLDTAWAAGVLFGKASNPKTWEFGASYQVVEKDALFAQLIDSDFGAGLSDSQGYKIVAAYAPTRNFTLNGTYFINDRNVDVANAVNKKEVGYDRMQLDFNVKF